MLYDGWNLLGGFRLLGDSLGGLARWSDSFSTVDAFGMVLGTGLTLVLVNVKGLGSCHFLAGSGVGEMSVRKQQGKLPPPPSPSTCCLTK